MNNGENARNQKFIMMTTKPVEGLICRLAVPTIISMLVTTFYNMADTYFVGKIGFNETESVKAAMQTQATAAVGVVAALMAIIQALGFFFGHGSGNYISRGLGNRDTENTAKIASAGFYYAIIAGVLLAVLGNVFGRPLAFLLGATEGTVDYTLDYMRIILLGAPINMASLVLNNQIRFQGNAAFAMFGISFGAMLNIGLDALFILVFDMEVIGAALATVIGQAVSLVLLIIGVYKSDCVKVSLKNLRFDRFSFAEIAKGGLPSLGRQGIASISAACLNNMAATYGAAYYGNAAAGDSAIASMSIVSRIMLFAASTLIGFGQGFQPVCGFNYGAGLNLRVKKAFWFCVKSALIFLVMVAVPVFIFSENIIAVFRPNDPIALKIGTDALRWQTVTFPVMSWVVISNMMLQTMGKTVSATILAVARQGLAFIPMILILPPALGLLGVETAQPAADIIAIIISIPVTLKVLRELSIDRNPENSLPAGNKQ